MIIKLHDTRRLPMHKVCDGVAVYVVRNAAALDTLVQNARAWPDAFAAEQLVAYRNEIREGLRGDHSALLFVSSLGVVQKGDQDFVAGAGHDIDRNPGALEDVGKGIFPVLWGFAPLQDASCFPRTVTYVPVPLITTQVVLERDDEHAAVFRERGETLNRQPGIAAARANVTMLCLVPKSFRGLPKPPMPN